MQEGAQERSSNSGSISRTYTVAQAMVLLKMQQCLRQNLRDISYLDRCELAAQREHARRFGPRELAARGREQRRRRLLADATSVPGVSSLTGRSQ